jgi:hypothetical protein
MKVNADFYRENVRPVYERTYETARARDAAGRSSMPITIDDYTTLALAAHDVVIFAGRLERADSYLDECAVKSENVDIETLRAMLRDPVKPDATETATSATGAGS